MALFVWATQVANEGVAVFFLISGFLLYRPFLVARRAGDPTRLLAYARRRVLRIVPAYWAALSIFLAAGLVPGVNGGNWWVFYGFGQIYSVKTLGSGIGVAWTLCIEVTFYAALPLFAWVASRAGPRRFSVRSDLVLLVVLAAASLAFRGHFSSFLQTVTVSTLPGTFFWFALGMSLAIASVSFERRSLGAAPRWPAASWMIAGVLWVVLHEVAAHAGSLGTPAANVLIHVLYGLTAFFVLLPAVFGERAGGAVRSLLARRWLAWVGLISYAFYLYHTIVIAQVAKHLHGSARYPIIVVASLILSIACAGASYYLLERPVMRLRRRGRVRYSVSL